MLIVTFFVVLSCWLMRRQNTMLCIMLSLMLSMVHMVRSCCVCTKACSEGITNCTYWFGFYCARHCWCGVERIHCVGQMVTCLLNRAYSILMILAWWMVSNWIPSSGSSLSSNGIFWIQTIIFGWTRMMHMHSIARIGIWMNSLSCIKIVVISFHWLLMSNRLIWWNSSIIVNLLLIVIFWTSCCSLLRICCFTWGKMFVNKRVEVRVFSLMLVLLLLGGVGIWIWTCWLVVQCLSLRMPVYRICNKT